MILPFSKLKSIHRIIKIGKHPIFFYGLITFLQGLLLGLLSIIIPKVSTIWFKNPSGSIGFPLKVTGLLT
jgi:hypothetical protein